MNAIQGAAAAGVVALVIATADVTQWFKATAALGNALADIGDRRMLDRA